MPKMKNVEKKIWDVEGFDVRVKSSDGTDIRSDRSGIPQYKGKKASKNAMTVSDWKDKFKRQYPGLTVDILDGDGKVVSSGQTQLGTVRDTYADPEEE